MKLSICIVCCFLFFLPASAQFFERKVFRWNVPIPKTPVFRLDNTYTLFIRKIYRDSSTHKGRPFGNSVARFECMGDCKDKVLTEIQYLYYSQTHKNAMLIILLPNYPRRENKKPTYNLPEIRDVPVVNIWSANCFLFGKMDAGEDTLSFQYWNDDRQVLWSVKVDPAGESVQIIGAGERKDGKESKQFLIAEQLVVNVICRRAPSHYPLNVDGRMLNRENKMKDLAPVFYYEKVGKKKYRLLIPYRDQLNNSFPKKGIAFKGKKARDNRLPYDVSTFFQPE